MIDPLELQLRKAHDSVVQEEWAPARDGTVPEVRIGKRWVSVAWLLAGGFVMLIGGIAIAREARTVPSIADFIARYPGVSAAPTSYHGFPLWLRIQHALNIVFMMLIIRSGIQILADHPRLYWSRDCTPGSEWFRFQRPVPRGRLWTSRDDAVTIPGWLGIPGIRHSIGLARWWHFSAALFWLINGAVFYALLFCTAQWQRLVPTSWDVLPNALSMLFQYLSLDLPQENSWTHYNALQQIAYFITVFLAAPAALFTGLMQAPAIVNATGWLGRLFHRQAARSIHFLILLWFVQFIIIHITMVMVTGIRHNLNYMTIGVKSESLTGVTVTCAFLALFFWLWIAASPFTLKHARLVQNTGSRLVGRIKALMEMWDPKTEYEESDISPFLWPNGLVPESEQYKTLAANGFADYKLRIDGLVDSPRELSYEEIKSMPRQEQITAHHCIQGWSGVAKWTGVPVRDVIDLVKPKPEARYVVFYSFGEGGEGGIYYDVHSIENMRHQLTILAYEMNGKTLPIVHGAPLRLRCENELGFKQVKWIQAIEFVDDMSRLGDGHGGYNEDHEFYGYRVPI